MGSVELLPLKRAAANLADVWRSRPVAGSGLVRVRDARLEDYAAIRALQRRSAPFAPEITLRRFESRRVAFPGGQLVAVCEGQIVGAASSLVVSWDDHGARHTWRSITGDGFFTTHDPEGSTLYAAELVADDSPAGFGVRRALLQARRRLSRRMNLRRIIATARLGGYRASAAEPMTPEQYAMRVIWGDIAEAAMRLLMTQGFQYCGILHDYLPEDEDSRGHAALLAWINPMYSPPRPPACEESERPRKCA